MYNWNLYDDADRWRYCSSWEKSPQAFRVPVMCKLAYSICTELLGLLPKPLYCSHLHIVIQMWMPLRAFFKDPKSWKSHGDKSGMCVGYLSSSHCVAFSWTWTLYATWECATLCSRMLLLLSLPWHFVHLDMWIFKCLTVMFCIDYVVTWFEVQKWGGGGNFMLLWSCLDGFTNGTPSLFKLGCDVVGTSYLFILLYCSAEVSVGVFTASDMQLWPLY
jgi:hypothetical protein